MHAIFNAASRLTRDGYTVLPEIEIPLTISKAEMEILKGRCDRIARECMELHRVSFTYLCGSMIDCRARPAGRGNRGVGGVLQLWDQRPHADMFRVQP